MLALSNSGETVEMTDLVGYSRRFTIPLIAITAREKSALATAADIVLLLPAAEEACPVGLAPTTSTTMQLALGDAIAVALMERRGFTAAHFREFHPRGALGARLAKVGDLMHADLPLASPGQKMADVLIKMTAKRFGCVAVVDAQGERAGEGHEHLLQRTVRVRAAALPRGHLGDRVHPPRGEGQRVGAVGDDQRAAGIDHATQGDGVVPRAVVHCAPQAARSIRRASRSSRMRLASKYDSKVPASVQRPWQTSYSSFRRHRRHGR